MNTSDTHPRDQHPSDPGYERLRATDPASAAEPDLTVIQAKVTDPAAKSQVGAAAAVALVTDLADQRAVRRPHRWLQVAAAAAGVIAVGAGAFTIGQQTADAPPTADAPRAPTSTPDSEATAPETTTAPDPAQGAAPAGPVPEGGFAAGAQDGAPSSKSTGMAADMVAPGYGRTVFTSSGLAQTPTSGPAWGFDATAAFSAETATRLAAALGVSGAPTLNYGSWHVGSSDWTSATIDLTADGVTSFFFSNPAHNPWDEGATTSPATPEAATTALSDAITALGVDPEGYTVTVDSTQDLRGTSVTATRLQGGGESMWSAIVTADGVFTLSGSLAPLVDLGTYNVISPQAAVERLGDDRFGATPDYSTYATADMAIARPGAAPAPSPFDPAAIPVLPGAAAPGASFAWPVADVTITEARLGTGTYYQQDGSVARLPTYTLTGSDGGAWTVLALADAHLDFSASS